ncbi:MAG: hypothetical protein PVJ04_10990 [Gemmatimonadota bacterium]
MSGKRVTIRILFADEGTFHHEDMELPTSVIEEYDRLIDGLREDPGVLKRVHLDLRRLVAAWVEDAE